MVLDEAFRAVLTDAVLEIDGVAVLLDTVVVAVRAVFTTGFVFVADLDVVALFELFVRAETVWDVAPGNLDTVDFVVAVLLDIAFVSRDVFSVVRLSEDSLRTAASEKPKQIIQPRIIINLFLISLILYIIAKI